MVGDSFYELLRAGVPSAWKTKRSDHNLLSIFFVLGAKRENVEWHCDSIENANAVSSLTSVRSGLAPLESRRLKVSSAPAKAAAMRGVCPFTSG